MTDRFPLIIPSNIFSSWVWDVLGLSKGPSPDIAFFIFIPPSKDLLPPSGRSNTLNECSTAGTSGTSSKTFAVDFRRPKPLGNLGI